MRGDPKMVIKWERWVHRSATEKDVADEAAERAEGRSLWGDIKVGDDLEYEEETELPGKYEVCGRCQGKGSHTNPSIDGHGISMEEWWGPDWDDESREDYLSGAYDVCCYECTGKRVVLVLDEERCDKELLKQYYKSCREKAAEDYADRRMRWAEDGGLGSMDDY